MCMLTQLDVTAVIYCCCVAVFENQLLKNKTFAI